MSFRRTLILTLVVMALGVWVYFVERPGMEADQAPDRLLTVKAEDVASIILSYPDRPSIELLRERSGWRMTGPIESAADGQAVERLLTTIEELELERRIGADERQAMEVYGLGEQGEQANLELGLADGSTLPAIIVGRTTPVGFSAFARLAGSEEIAVTPLLFHTGVKKYPFDLREKRLLVFEPKNVIAIELSSPEKGTIGLQRQGNRWRITTPVTDEADREQVEGLLLSATQLKASAFFDDKKASGKLGLARPAFSIRIEVAGQGHAQLAFGKAVPESAPPASYVVRLPDGQVAKVESAMRVRLDKDLGTLRDKRLFDCEPQQVGRMVFERSGRAGFALERGDSGSWAMEPEVGGPLRQALIERALGGLTGMAGTDIAAENAGDFAAYGLAPAALEVELYSHDRTTCGRALAGRVEEPERTRYFVKRNDGEMVMTVPEYLYSRMDRLATDFVESQ